LHSVARVVHASTSSFIYVLLFVSQSHRPPLHLHPFPTRRSSDLPSLLDITVKINGISLFQGNNRLLEVVGTSFEQTALGVAALLDRKSTRLNSSHVSISYAVFCLKKKKEEIGRGLYSDVTVRHVG